MARQQKKTKANNASKKFEKQSKKPQNRKQKEDKLTSNDIFEAEEQVDRRKGHDLDQVDNLEYDAGEINEEDDEEIDSDEAFDESDEERFEDYKFSGSTKSSDKKQIKKAQKIKEGEIDLNEDSEDSQDESEAEDGEGFVDLSQMLGDNQDEEMEDDVEYSEDEEEFKGFDDLVDEDEDEDSDNDDQLANFVEGLETKKRRRNDEELTGSKSKRRQVKEKNEAYQESEFNLNTRDDNNNKISLNDLVSNVDDEATLGSLKEGIDTLIGKGKNLTRRALDAPLPKRIQDRMEREAAAATANEEVSKWQPTVQKNRMADHLSFPLQEVDAVARDGKSSASLASKFNVETPLEKQISEALAAAGMKDEELEAFEALKLNKLSVEEVDARRKELRMMRELMFRHEMKNKRLKKIKSKSYRKLKRKDQEKLGAQVQEAEELNHDIDDDDKMKAAMSRAEERMTLKHKNTSQWAKRALARGDRDEGTRDAIMDQLRRGEELRRKIDGSASEKESDDDDDLDISEQINNLKQDIEQDTQPKKGLLSMKFMQDAAKREADVTKNELEAFEKEWLNADSDDDKDSNDKESDNFAIISNNPGRMAFGASAKKQTITQKAEKEDENDRNTYSDDENIEQVVSEKKITEIKVVEAPSGKKSDSKKDKKAETPNKKSKQKKMKITATTPSKKAQNDEDENRDLMIHSSNLTFNQRDLVARAFANDDVVTEFEEEKLAEIARDGDKEEDLTLPGWGSWSGSGMKPKNNKRKIIKVTKGIAADKRKDAKLANVIINENANKKTEKYQTSAVPFPFKTIEQYERSLATPVGSEWNTNQTFSKMTKPRVMTKLGKVIDPLSVPFL